MIIRIRKTTVPCVLYRFLLIAVYCIIIDFAHAGTAYYVDCSHPYAADSNPGTETLPWLTIQHAAEEVSPGDTVFVKSGTYEERVEISVSGSSTDPVVFTALPRRAVTVLHGFAIFADYVTIRGFNITHDEGGWLNNGVWIQGSNIEIDDNYIYGVPGQGICSSWADQGMWTNIHIVDNSIYGCNKGIVISGYNWIVEYNEIERLIYYNEDADYMRFFGKDIIIQGNYMHGTYEYEIGESHTDMFQTFNVYGDTYAENIVIERNMCIGFFHQGLMASTDYPGSQRNILVRNNVFTSGTSWGICAHSIRDLHIINNTFFNMGYHGVGFRDNTTGTVKNNIFHGSNSAYWHDASSSYEHGYNLTFECGRAPDPMDSTDILDTDPCFADTGDILGPDNMPFTSDDGLQLQPGSPAIGQGENGVDIGAYGFGENAPEGFCFFWIAPNPFNARTYAFITLFRSSGVKLSVFDCTGRHVRTVTNTYYAAGIHSLEIDGNDLSNGVYVFVLVVNGHQYTHKVVVTK